MFARIPALYARHNDAASDLVNILKSHFDGVSPVKYVVPLIVEVYSDDPVSSVEVVDFLSDHSRLYLNTTIHGHGPRKSLVVPTIHWDQIEEVTSE